MVMEQPKHIVVLSQFFPPERAPFSRAVAKALHEHGYKVSVVTGYPNRPGGKLFSGYKQRLRFSEVIGGIRVHRVPMIINHSSKAMERILNFLSFSISALTVSRTIKDADAVYVYATPATAAIPAQIWRKFYGIPYVLHVQDLWPESVTDSGMIGNKTINRLVHRLLSHWTDSLYSQSEALIAISHGMKDMLVQRGNNAGSCNVIYNWADETNILPKTSSAFTDNSLHLLYAGNLGPMQDLETVIKAASLNPERTNFRLTFAGEGIMEDTLRDNARAAAEVEFVGRLGPQELNKLYLESDFQLVTLKDLPIFRGTVPSKLQASLAAGVPVITTVKGTVAHLIHRYNAGIVAEPENVESLSSAFRTAYEMSAAERARMGRNARQLYEEQMSHAAGTESIVDIIDLVSRGTE